MKHKKNYYIQAFLIIAAVFLVSCAVQQPPQAPAQDTPGEESQASDSEENKGEEVSLKGVPSEIRELLDKSNRANSLFYKYKGPETENNFFDFYVKENLIAYKPNIGSVYIEEEFYDTIYLDAGKKTAASYCAERGCTYPGKKQDLDYESQFIDTPYDWIKGITYAEKLGEENLQRRSVWKINTNKGTLWIDTYYGVPLQAMKEGKLYEFEAMAFNDVEDSDVTPGSA